jgi:cytochrome c-type biogenesis protein
MEFGLASYGLGYLAGVVSTLSPCVLPLVPIVIGTAVAAHKYGPLALALGLILSFTTIGVLLASAGSAFGLDQSTFRMIAAVILILFGVILLSTGLQQRFAGATSSLSDKGQGLLARLSPVGLHGQFIVGLVLGLVWTPCVGPTLGAATTLASQGQNLGQVGLLMALFGLGAGTPMIILGALSRSTIMRLRGKLMSAGKLGKYVLGFIMLALGIAILTGYDKVVEIYLLDNSPEWLTEFTTRF